MPIRVVITQTRNSDFAGFARIEWKHVVTDVPLLPQQRSFSLHRSASTGARAHIAHKRIGALA